MTETFHKTGPARALAFEAAGLHWLAETARSSEPGSQRDHGAPVVDVVELTDGTLHTRRLHEAQPTTEAAEAFGRALAHTHAAGAAWFGCPPPGYSAPEGFIGTTRLPLRHEAPASWGTFYAEDRLLPYLSPARENGSLDEAGATTVERCAARVVAGDFDAPQPRLVTEAGHGASRLHGDLWSGNVMWAAAPRGGAGDIGDGGAGVVGTLIDPAAHGGHAESDLAQLGVFGAPHRERIVAAYDDASPLAEGWPERVGLHQLHMLIVHAAIFGGGYGAQTAALAARYT